MTPLPLLQDEIPNLLDPVYVAHYSPVPFLHTNHPGLDHSKRLNEYNKRTRWQGGLPDAAQVANRTG